MPIRPSNTVELIKRRLEDAEHADQLDPMELVGLHDELMRLERKWRMQIAEGSERRRPGDPAKLDAWFERLNLLVARAMRETDEPARRALTSTAAAIAARNAKA